MAILKSVLLVAAMGTVVCTAQNSESRISRDTAPDQGPVPGWLDIQIQAEEAVVGNFAGFFDVTLRTTHIEDGTVSHTDLEHGSIALTFKDFTNNPVPIDHPTGFSGMIVLGRDKYPMPINLTARQRKQGNMFNVSLSGITDSESVGVATVDAEAITIRLVDEGPQTTVLKLRRQTSLGKQTAPAADNPINYGPAKPYVPDGLPSA